MRTEQATGRRWVGGRAPWAATAAATLAVVAATTGGAGKASAFDYLGDFKNVESAPAGTPEIGGIASMVVTTRATTTSISATGLDPAAVYVADVHDHSCFEQEGGAPFQFDPAGEKTPPNAIWMYPIKVVGSRAIATTTSQRPAGPRAKSVIIHLLRAPGADKDNENPPRLACADLFRATS